MATAFQQTAFQNNAFQFQTGNAFQCNAFQLSAFQTPDCVGPVIEDETVPEQVHVTSAFFRNTNYYPDRLRRGR